MVDRLGFLAIRVLSYYGYTNFSLMPSRMLRYFKDLKEFCHNGTSVQDQELDGTRFSVNKCFCCPVSIQFTINSWIMF
ncbi:hypothetical protein CsSME_00038347 [Camellia sinensis var. sinensis]